MSTIFLLSPAHCGGRRATYLLRENSTLALAAKLAEGTLTLGEAFTFMAPDEEGELRAIERAIKTALPRVTLPDFDYSAVAATPLEVPRAQRIAEIRQRRARERQQSESRPSRGRRRRGRGRSGPGSSS